MLTLRTQKILPAASPDVDDPASPDANGRLSQQEYEGLVILIRNIALTFWMAIFSPIGLVWADDPVKPISELANSKPNIIVILTDDQGRGDYSAFGTKDIRTPNIDRVFSEGMTYDNFFANSCVCSPTRAALLTGCYPDQVGVPGVIREETPDGSWGYLAADAILLPQLLKPAGYHTAIIGKWHLGISSPNTPTERGFDFFHGFLGDMMDDYWHHRRNGHNFMRRNREVIEPVGHASDLFSDWACEYLTERKKAGAPFFLYLAYNAPHEPIQPPAEWVKKVKQREPEISDKRANLLAFIEHLDDGIGRVLDTLDRLQLAENTLVIFSADNGGVKGVGANNGPWRGGKTEMFEGGLRVPGAARWPALIKPGSATDRLTLSMDIFPTACEAAGVKTPSDVDGVSFLSTLQGEAEARTERFYYFIWRDHLKGHAGKSCQAIRRGNWKLMQNTPFQPFALYDLKNDPAETTNVAEKNPKVVHELTTQLRKQIQRAGAVPWQAPERKP